jgi:DNA-binding ferritin-like protein
MVKELLGDHETIIVHLRKDVDTSTDVNKDAGTADFWLDESTRNNGMDTKKIFRIIKNYMENSTNEVCIASRSYCSSK